MVLFPFLLIHDLPHQLIILSPYLVPLVLLMEPALPVTLFAHEIRIAHLRLISVHLYHFYTILAILYGVVLALVETCRSCAGESVPLGRLPIILLRLFVRIDFHNILFLNLRNLISVLFHFLVVLLVLVVLGVQVNYQLVHRLVTGVVFALAVTISCLIHFLLHIINNLLVQFYARPRVLLVRLSNSVMVNHGLVIDLVSTVVKY